VQIQFDSKAQRKTLSTLKQVAWSKATEHARSRGWKVDQIEAALEDFVLDQQNRGLADSTINRSMSALRRMFRLGLKKRMLTLIPAFPMLNEPDAREGFFDEDHYRRLSDELPEHLRLPLALGFYTGMRLGEVLAVEWDQVNLIDSTIRLRGAQTKSGKPRVIPIIPQLRALVEKQHARRQAECPYVCFRLDRKGHAARINGFRKAWYSACIRAGLSEMIAVTDGAGKPVFAKPRGPRSKPKMKMTYKGAIFHDLRRSAVRNLIRSGVPRSIAMDISGHRTENVFERYNIGSEADIRGAGEKLAAYHVAQNVRDVEGTSEVEAPTANKLIN
jgi:integrase